MSNCEDQKPSIEAISRADLFSSFSGKELTFLSEHSSLLSLDAKEELFHSGDRAQCLYIVVSGSIEIASATDASILAEFVPGDSFGELELLTQAPRNANAYALVDTQLVTFPACGETLKEAFSTRPEVAARILRTFLLVISQRTRKSNALVKENSPWVRELQRQVYGDKLTGLLNRAWLEENLPRALTGDLALIMLKPDNFKEINDRFGHEAGDSALVLMATEFEAIVTSIDEAATAVRYDGNELAVMLPGANREAARAAAKTIQERLALLDISSATGDRELHLRISLGIALHPDHAQDAPSLIRAVSGLPLLGRSRGGSCILFPEDQR